MDGFILELLVSCYADTVIYGTHGGVIQMLEVLTNRKIKLLDIKTKLTNEEKDTISYYKERESFFWKVIEDYYYGTVCHTYVGNPNLLK